MASLVVLSFSSLFFALSLVLLLGINPACSTSRRAIDHHPNLPQSGFRVTLKHVDSGKNLTKFERLQRGIKRGQHRLQRLNAMKVAATSLDKTKVEVPVFAGNGEFLMRLGIGTPAKSFSAIVDTGSDLIWTQCEPCVECFDQKTPIFNPKKSSTFSKLSCFNTLCSALPTSTCDDGCEYFYSYGDYSSTQGVLASETFTFGDHSSDKVSIPKLGFGCGNDNEGVGFNQGDGLVGLGRGPLSLVMQLKEPKFSYCLTSIENSKTSTLLMGSLASVNKSTSSAIKTTPLIKNQAQPSFYYLSLEGITVGDSRLPIRKSTFDLNDDGNGGLIIDSGTTLTYIQDSAFQLLKKEFISQTKLPVSNSSSTGLDLCFNLPSDSKEVSVPKLTFHFQGADLEFPAENYIIADSSIGLMCLAMASSSDMSIFGNIQQQNLMVIHDLVKETISFVPTQCDEL